MKQKRLFTIDLDDFRRDLGKDISRASLFESYRSMVDYYLREEQVAFDKGLPPPDHGEEPPMSDASRQLMDMLHRHRDEVDAHTRQYTRELERLDRIIEDGNTILSRPENRPLPFTLDERYPVEEIVMEEYMHLSAKKRAGVVLSADEEEKLAAADEAMRIEMMLSFGRLALRAWLQEHESVLGITGGRGRPLNTDQKDRLLRQWRTRRKLVEQLEKAEFNLWFDLRYPEGGGDSGERGVADAERALDDFMAAWTASRRQA